MNPRNDNMPKKDQEKKFSMNWGLIMIFTLLAAILFDRLTLDRSVQSLPYSEFLTRLNNNEIQEVAISTDDLQGQYKPSPESKLLSFKTVRVEDPELIQRLQDKKIPFRGVGRNVLFESLISWVLPFALIFIFWRFLFRRVSQATSSGFLPLGKSKARVYVEKGLKITFEDVAGVEEAKEELREVVNFLKEPAKFTTLGGHAPKGILLIGPPGTGKTLLAKAVAGEAKVPFFSINGSEFVEMFVGLGAARVRDLFEQARQNAPCIIFIDELDALGKSRATAMHGMGANDEKEQTLNQLLAELDGFDSSQGVVLLAATNRPEILDPALLRSGRFDRQVLVDKPDKAGREQILKVHVKTVKMASTVDISAVAGLTAGFSGADLANLVNEAALAATRRKAKAVEQQDFTAAVERIVAGLEYKHRVLSPDEKRRVAVHEMGHATVALALTTSDKVHKVSIIPRGVGSLGYTISRPTEDRYLSDRQELIHKIAVLLGGRAAEELYFSAISTGIHNDLARANDMAREMVMKYGMSEALGLLTVSNQEYNFLKSETVQTYAASEATAKIVDAETQRILSDAYGLAKDVLRKRKVFMEESIVSLLKRETLGEEEILHLWQEFPAAA